MRKLLCLAVLGILSQNVNAVDQKKVFQSGDWQVMQSQDPMNDKLSCTAIHKGNWTIQATRDKFFVSLSRRGGIKGYTVRIGDGAADPMKLATDIERQIGAVVLGNEFPRIYEARRIRVQSITVLDTIVLDDISLNGFKQAVDYMRVNDC